MLFKSLKKRTTLVSAHIPKAGGTSFRTSIEANYKDSEILFVYDAQALSIVNSPQEADLVNTRVLHGHFQPNRALLETLNNPFLVTWLRNPVERLVSLYSYWQNLEPSGMAIHDQFVETQPSITEFAKWPAIQGEVLNYFSDIPITEYDFVGVVENYEADLALLGKTIGWKHTPVVWANQTESKYQIKETERKLIADSLSEDIELYNSVLTSRNLVHLAA